MALYVIKSCDACQITLVPDNRIHSRVCRLWSSAERKFIIVFIARSFWCPTRWINPVAFDPDISNSDCKNSFLTKVYPSISTWRKKVQCTISHKTSVTKSIRISTCVHMLSKSVIETCKMFIVASLKPVFFNICHSLQRLVEQTPGLLCTSICQCCVITFHLYSIWTFSPHWFNNFLWKDLSIEAPQWSQML